MVRQPFDESEWDDLLGPSDAFEPQDRANPSVYTIQNHLALEVMAHLTGAAVPILFQGGTALHVKLGDLLVCLEGEVHPEEQPLRAVALVVVALDREPPQHLARGLLAGISRLEDDLHQRVPAPGISFEQPNLPTLIEEIESDILPSLSSA